MWPGVTINELDGVRTRWSSEDEADRFTVENPATGARLAVIQGALRVSRALRTGTLHEYGYSKSIRLPSGTADIPRWAPSLEVTGH